jgi:hypothetical protein
VTTETGQQRQPHLTFACELDRGGLTELFSDASVIEDLQALGANVVLMLSDFSPERAAVVKKLNAAGIPVTAIPLLPYEEGYYFTADNAPRALERYEEWKAWTAEHGLVWEGVGLDIEPEARFYEQIMENPWGLVPMLLLRLRDTERPRRARAAYAALIERIHANGYSVENYQFPLIADERRTGSTLLQRLMGLVDVRTDREVWMQYNSFLPTLGPGLLWSYGPEAQALAVGTTGGGPDVAGHPQFSPLSWEEFARDLRLARHFADDLFIHSLEGCVWQGYLTRLRSFDWEQPAALPKTAPLAEGLRAALRGMLWASAHPWSMLGGVAVATVWLLSRWRRRRT